MSRAESSTREPPSDPRRCALLEAALTVFARFGFRKTSMDEVARAAQVSRQGLYLHFATKEELFREAMGSALSGALRAAREVLGDASLSLETRLVRAFDAWLGRYVGMMGAGASDLVEASRTLVGPMFAQYEGQFAEAVTKAIAGSRLMATYKASGLTARQLTDTLQATARGLKYSSASREAFVQSMTIAVRMLCAPLAEAR